MYTEMQIKGSKIFKWQTFWVNTSPFGIATMMQIDRSMFLFSL
jgi:hypothetical protein